MRVVGSAKGINIHAPDDAYFSYFNSPYIGHNIGSAVDIYPHHQKWGGMIESPISGKVVRIKKMNMGREKQFPTDDFDYAIGILPEGFENTIVRVMHCEPTISEGEIVALGDHIGKALRSRYFNYWTGPHYHVEIQALESFQRSSQSLPLTLKYQFKPEPVHNSLREMELFVDLVTSDRLVGFPENLAHSTIGALSGLSATTDDGNVVGIIDGGLSHYKIGGVIGPREPIHSKHVSLNESAVGTITESRPSVCIFTHGPCITTYLDKTEIRGLSCFIYPRQYLKKKVPQLILIPKSYGQFNELFTEGEVYGFRILSDNNIVKAD